MNSEKTEKTEKTIAFSYECNSCEKTLGIAITKNPTKGEKTAIPNLCVSCEGLRRISVFRSIKPPRKMNKIYA